MQREELSTSLLDESPPREVKQAKLIIVTQGEYKASKHEEECHTKGSTTIIEI